MCKKINILLLVLFYCFCYSVFAEKITLRSGRVVEGDITEKTDEYIKVDFQGVSLTYYMDEIKQIGSQRYVSPNKADLQSVANGFRNIKWGTEISQLKNTMVRNTDTACGDVYYIKNDDLTVFGIPVKFIRYGFHKGKFFRVKITLKSKARKPLSHLLKEQLEEHYGWPDDVKVSGDGKYRSTVYTWTIDKVKVVLDISQSFGGRDLTYTYKPILEKCKKYLGQ